MALDRTVARTPLSLLQQPEQRPDICCGPMGIGEPAMLPKQMLLRTSFVAKLQPVDLATATSPAFAFQLWVALLDPGEIEFCVLGNQQICSIEKAKW